eukprot:4407506-Alexandrium_andersonii.AAC.1
MLNWRKAYSVRLRCPNTRFKVSMATFRERVRIMWLNVLRVRTRCQLVHGYDPVIEGADQKLLHFNESGS